MPGAVSGLIGWVKKAVTSKEALILAAAAAGSAVVAAAGTGEIADQLGIEDSKEVQAIENAASRLTQSATNLSGSLLLTGGAINNYPMAAFGAGLQIGLAAGQKAHLPTGETPSGLVLKGHRKRDLASLEPSYDVETVEIPDWVSPEEKYSRVGDLLAQVAMEGSEDPAVVRQAKEIVAEAGATNPYEMAVALGRWVQENVVYVLDEHNPLAEKNPGQFKPEPGGSLEIFQAPGQTLASRYADCDCQAICLSSMLHALGIPSKFRLISQDEQAPNMYSHVYTVAELPGGRDLPLDATPIISEDGQATYHPMGWEADSAGSLDVALPLKGANRSRR